MTINNTEKMDDIGHIQAYQTIHNSDYDSVASCKTAIDRYFAERNAHFSTHPKRAGKKI